MKKKFSHIILLFFAMNVKMVFANENCPTCPAIPGIDGTDDEPAGAPIDQALIWLVIAGLIVAFYFITKQKAVKA